MNNADLTRFLSAKSSIKCLVDNAVRYQTKTQNEILKEKEFIIDDVYAHNKRTPLHLGSSLRAYFDGYWDSKSEGKTVFLYKKGGQFYKLGHSHQKDIDAPCWDTLPREEWDTIAQYGGIYWRDTLKPFYVAK